MKKEFVPYNLAIELKELGFDEPCICGYDNEGSLRGKLASTNDKGERTKIDWDKHDSHLPAPLWQQAFRWFIEKHNLNGQMYYNFNGKWDFNIQKVEAGLLSGANTAYIQKHNTFDEGQYACLKTLIDAIKNGK